MTGCARRLQRRLTEPWMVAAVACRVEWHLRRRTPLPRICSSLGVHLELDGEPAQAYRWLPWWAGVSARWTDRIIRHLPFPDTCLRRCLVLGGRISALQPVLRIGVRSCTQRIEAHSWLEVGGLALDPSAPRFTMLGVGR